MKVEKKTINPGMVTELLNANTANRPKKPAGRDRYYRAMMENRWKDENGMTISIDKNGLILETNIEDFMQYFSEDEKESFVQVRINLTLIDVKTSKVLATKTFESKIKVDSINSDAGVKQLNIALENVLKSSAEWFGEVCQ